MRQKNDFRKNRKKVPKYCFIIKELKSGIRTTPYEEGTESESLAIVPDTSLCIRTTPYEEGTER